MSGECTIKVTVDAQGKFAYQWESYSRKLILKNSDDLNVNGVQDVKLTFYMGEKSEGSFCGFQVAENRSPGPNRGWTALSTLQGFGIQPVTPSPWPAPDSTDTTVDKLVFNLNLKECTRSAPHVFYYRPIAKVGDTFCFDDPKIYNDPPPTDPPPTDEPVPLPWLREMRRLERWGKRGIDVVKGLF